MFAAMTMAMTLHGTLMLSSLSHPQDIEVPNLPPQVGHVFPNLQFPYLSEEGQGSLGDFRDTKVLLIQFASW